MGEVRLIPLAPESTAVLPQGDTGRISTIFNSLSSSPLFYNPEQEIQLFKFYSQDIIVINAARYQVLFRDLTQSKTHDPEILKMVSTALADTNGLFQRFKTTCDSYFPYWFSELTLEATAKKIVSSLFMKGLIGTSLRIDLEPVHPCAKALAIDFKMSLKLVGENHEKAKAFELLLPMHAKLAAIAKRALEFFGDNKDLQEQIQARITHLNIRSFEQLTETQLADLDDIDQILNRALNEEKALYPTQENGQDYELVDDEKQLKYRIPKGVKIVLPYTNPPHPPCPGFTSGMVGLKVMLVYLLMKGTFLKETNRVWGTFYIPTTRVSYRFSPSTK